MLVSSKELLDIQGTIESGFTRKCIRERMTTHSQMHRADKYSLQGSVIWPVWPNGCVFIYELGGCRFENRCSHLDKPFVCKTCQTRIHKKSWELRLSYICDIKNSKTETYWECQTCMSDKFLFSLVDNKVIVQNSFNSSFSCKCQTLCKYEIGILNLFLNTELMMVIMKVQMVTSLIIIMLY